VPPAASNAFDAYFYSYADESFTNISPAWGASWDTHMSGSRIVWTMPTKREGQTVMQIAVYDTKTQTQEVPEPTQSDQYYARIDGDKVVWVDHRNAPGGMTYPGNSDIYMHDISTGETVPVTTHPAQQTLPDVWGDWVVWMDWRDNPDPTPGAGYKESDIYAKNMKTGEVVQVTDLPGLETHPRIDDGRIFFDARSTVDNKVAFFMIDMAARGLEP
jgi:beta propeller repeat protein